MIKHSFALDSPFLLEIDLNGTCRVKAGCIVGYRGNVRFAETDALSLTLTQGLGRLYVADLDKRVYLIALNDDDLYVTPTDVLAVEQSLNMDLLPLDATTRILGRSPQTARVYGTGLLAVATHSAPLTIHVTQSEPLTTDAKTTVAWSSGLQVAVKKTRLFNRLLTQLLDRQFHLEFQGQGWVLVQPHGTSAIDGFMSPS